MQIRVIDVFDDADFEPFHHLCERAMRHGRPHAPAWSIDTARAAYRTPSSDQRQEALGAFDADVLVGAVRITSWLLDNTNAAWVNVMVDPDHRRQGVGSALLAEAVDRIHAQGRAIVQGEAPYPFELREDSPARRFAQRHGFHLANTEVERVLDLPVAPELLEQLAAQAAPHHTAYEIRTFVDQIPQQLQQSYCDLLNSLPLESPQGVLDVEQEATTPGQVQENLALLTAMGRRSFVTLAISPDGRAVAHNDLEVTGDGQDYVAQQGTLARRDHRGHRLGTAVKVRGLQELQRAHPDKRTVRTSNAETNAQMVAINDRLGFRPVEILGQFQLRLTD